MNPSYFRIRLPLKDAKDRLRKWWGVEEPTECIETNASQAVDLAITPNGQWRGGALFFYENDGWSVFEDLSGGFGSVPSSMWQEFAQLDDFVFAGYNDAIPYGELIVIKQGIVLREFMNYPDDPDENINKGHLASEVDRPITSWVEVASFVDDDPFAFSDRGWLWVNEKR